MCFLKGDFAKVSPASADATDQHVICIYTDDHEDVSDVFRVIIKDPKDQLNQMSFSRI